MVTKLIILLVLVLSAVFFFSLGWSTKTFYIQENLKHEDNHTREPAQHQSQC